MRGIFIALLSIAAVAAIGHFQPAHAAPVGIEGLVFSDELGGFTIVEVSGRGTVDDPFVLIEEVTGPTPPVLVIRGLAAGFGNRVGTQHLVGFALTKIAINRTGDRWTQYELELRETLQRHSTYGDGLSFGQAAAAVRPFASSGFTSAHETTEPYDAMVFSGGAIAPGQSVTFSIVITETSPLPEFYLLQQQLRQVARR
jgi:hypothetical protein